MADMLLLLRAAQSDNNEAFTQFMNALRDKSQHGS